MRPTFYDEDDEKERPGEQGEEGDEGEDQQHEDGNSPLAKKIDYKIVLHHEILEKIVAYKQQLEQNHHAAGAHLKQIIMEEVGRSIGKTVEDGIKALEIDRFIQLLINTKKPFITAESSVFGNGIDWNETEMSLLGNINIAVPVTIFDDGKHRGPQKHPDASFEGTLLFTPGALLRNDKTGKTTDLDEVIGGDRNSIDPEKYYELYKKRILPLLQYASNLAFAEETKAFITVPGIGCGQFAGKFLGKLGAEFQKVLQRLLTEHGQELSNIQAVYYDPFNECSSLFERINNIDFIVNPLLGSKKPISQLDLLSKYSEVFEIDFSPCLFFSLVAWDPVSFPGNDFYKGDRLTDDGVKAAATDVMLKITGIEGNYVDKKSYSNVLAQYNPPSQYRNWSDVVEKERVTLIANQDNIFFYRGASIASLRGYAPFQPTVSSGFQNSSRPLSVKFQLDEAPELDKEAPKTCCCSCLGGLINFFRGKRSDYEPIEQLETKEVSPQATSKRITVTI